MQTKLIQIMSNETLRHFARFGTPIAEMKVAHRYDAIVARRELARRDRIATFGEAWA